MEMQIYENESQKGFSLSARDGDSFFMASTLFCGDGELVIQSVHQDYKNVYLRVEGEIAKEAISPKLLLFNPLVKKELKRLLSKYLWFYTCRTAKMPSVYNRWLRKMGIVVYKTTNTYTNDPDFMTGYSVELVKI